MAQRAEFDGYFESNYRPLCAFAYKFINDSDVVEDLVQEVFISFWDKIKSLDHEMAVKSYLYTSTRNKCLNHLKHDAVIKKHESQIKYEIESEELFQSQVVEEEVFGRLHNEIQNLPEAARKIMLLALKGLKNSEIARTLDVSENTVKTHKKIAYTRLKKRVNPATLLLFLHF